MLQFGVRFISISNGNPDKLLFLVTHVPFSLVDAALGAASNYYDFRRCFAKFGRACATKNRFFSGNTFDSILKLTPNCYTLLFSSIYNF